MTVRGRTRGFNQVMNNLERLQNRFEEESVKIAESVAEEVPSMFRDYLMDANLNVAPLAPSTVEQKARTGSPYADRVLVWWGDYRDSWDAFVSTTSGNIAVVFGPSGDLPNGISAESLAFILDRGTRTIPPRPHLERFIRMVYDRFFEATVEGLPSVFRR